MPLYEYVGNLHVHTRFSDGERYHAEVAEAALLAGLDFVVFTDHNVWLKGIEGYYGDERRGYVLLLSGEEVHDRTRSPQCNHLLVLGAECEMAPHADSLPGLIGAVAQAGGMSFLAHPDDRAVDWLHEAAIPWEDRAVNGFTGLEVWNTMSSFKEYIQTKREALRNVFRPEDVIVGPSPLTLKLWDDLLSSGQHVVGIGNADAHGTVYRMGPLSQTVFPYDFLFSCVNTHILTKYPFSGRAQHDKELLYQSLREGRAFIGYDIPGPTRGFRYSAQSDTTAIMGERVRVGHGVTLQVLAPARAHIKIICGGEVVAEAQNAENLTYTTSQEGAYRAELWRAYRGVERMWILSNPIFIDPNPGKLVRKTGEYSAVG